jgi:hypothetical protein
MSRQEKHSNQKTKDSNINITQTGVIVAIITVFGVIATAVFNYLSTRTQIELPIQATQTADARIYNSTIIATPTTNYISSTATVVFGPTNGRLIHDTNSNGLPAYISGVSLRNFIVDVRFYNPYDRAIGKWDYGIGFRETEGNAEYRLRIFSDGIWSLYLAGSSSAKLKDQTVQQGRLNNLDDSPNGHNDFRLVVNDEKADFILNNTYVATLDVSAKNIAGDIFVATGFFNDHQIDGKATLYEDFTIWSLP